MITATETNRSKVTSKKIISKGSWKSSTLFDSNLVFRQDTTLSSQNITLWLKVSYIFAQDNSSTQDLNLFVQDVLAWLRWSFFTRLNKILNRSKVISTFWCKITHWHKIVIFLNEIIILYGQDYNHVYARFQVDDLWHRLLGSRH